MLGLGPRVLQCASTPRRWTQVGCMQCHRVGIIVHVLLVKVAEGILDCLPPEAARSLDVGNRQEQVQTMLEDALADIGSTLGLPLRDTRCVRDYNRCPEGENRRVLDVCKFLKQWFAEGWLDKGDACSPPQQFFGGTVQRHVCSREFVNRICVCPGCSPISSGGLTPAEKSAAAHSYVWQHGGCGMHVVWSPCVAMQMRRKFLSVFAQLKRHKLCCAVSGRVV